MKTLFLTVGVGTGQNPTVDSALLWTIEQNRPDKCVLFHTNAERSQKTALTLSELSNIPSVLVELENPDELEECIIKMRNVILNDTSELKIVSGFSGTKTMSVAASIAAIETETNELQFTVGARNLGVVVEGTEKIQSVKPSSVFKMRELSIAKILFSNGSYAEAAALFSAHQYHENEKICMCLLNWENENFSEARRIAANSESLQPFRCILTNLAKEESLFASEIIMRETLHNAEIYALRGRITDAYLRIGKVIETMLKLMLEKVCGKRGPFKAEDFPDVQSTKGGVIYPSRSDMLHMLKVMKCNVKSPLNQIYDKRNKLIHHNKRLSKNDALHDISNISSIADSEFGSIKITERPSV